jgi:hypothetical protein
VTAPAIAAIVPVVVIERVPQIAPRAAVIVPKAVIVPRAAVIAQRVAAAIVRRLRTAVEEAIARLLPIAAAAIAAAP